MYPSPARVFRSDEQCAPITATSRKQWAEKLNLSINRWSWRDRTLPTLPLPLFLLPSSSGDLPRIFNETLFFLFNSSSAASNCNFSSSDGFDRDRVKNLENDLQENKFELLRFLDTGTIPATILISHAISKIKGKTGRLFVLLGWNARKLIGPL